MSLAHDVIVFDSLDAQSLASEADELLANLRRIEAALHDSRDDTGRFLYGQIRESIRNARWIQGGIREAMA